jgi:hypothetical protein
MHYMTHISHWKEKQKFGAMCPGALFVETAPGPPKHEKYCIDISWTDCTRTHYVTHRSHQMQKHKFGITYPGTLFVESILIPPKHE